MKDQRPLTQVAVGLVFDRTGRVLLGQRPAGKPYAGWWEFPGGKLEPGESVADALARELHEELGISVHASQPWIVREHSYSHARVRLYFRRVFDWSGEPLGREGQDFGWTRPEAIDREPLLPATVPILAMLALPRRVVGLAIDRLSQRAPPPPPPPVAGRAGATEHSRPRAVYVLHPDSEGSPLGETAPSRFESALARLRAIPGAVVCASGPFEAEQVARCDGVVAAADQLPARPVPALPARLHGMRIDRLDQLDLLSKVDADFAVIIADVSAHTHEFAKAVAGTSMPVYLLASGVLDSGARAGSLESMGLQGTASGYWPGLGPG